MARVARATQVHDKPVVPELEVPDPKVSYLRLGDDVYSLEKIDTPNIDINNEIKEFYRMEYESATKDAQSFMVEQIQEEFVRERDRIKTYRERGTVTIPRELYNKPVMFYGTMLLEVKFINYAPCVITGSKEYIFDHVYVPERLYEKFRRYANTTLLTVTFKAPFSFPVLVGFDKKNNQVWTPFGRTFHTFDNGRLCTGKAKGADFFNVESYVLESNMNRVNTFSLASSVASMVRGDRDSRCFQVRDLLNNVADITVSTDKSAKAWTTTRPGRRAETAQTAFTTEEVVEEEEEEEEDETYDDEDE